MAFSCHVSLCPHQHQLWHESLHSTKINDSTNLLQCPPLKNNKSHAFLFLGIPHSCRLRQVPWTLAAWSVNFWAHRFSFPFEVNKFCTISLIKHCHHVQFSRRTCSVIPTQLMCIAKQNGHGWLTDDEMGWLRRSVPEHQAMCEWMNECLNECEHEWMDGPTRPSHDVMPCTGGQGRRGNVCATD